MYVKTLLTGEDYECTQNQKRAVLLRRLLRLQWGQKADLITNRKQAGSFAEISGVYPPQKCRQRAFSRQYYLASVQG